MRCDLLEGGLSVGVSALKRIAIRAFLGFIIYARVLDGSEHLGAKHNN